MIISGNYNIYDVRAFVEGLGKAVLGVVRVSIIGASGSECSGWLITDNLVVVPDYAVTGGEKFLCYSGNDAAIEAVLVSRPTEKGTGEMPALLQLNQPLTAKAPGLDTATPKINDMICILQYPAKVNAHFSIGNITNVDATGLEYTASTQPGSGGGPVISLNSWKVLGMHTMAGSDPSMNKGIRLDPILDTLRLSTAWPEIAQFHRMAETASEPPAPIIDLSAGGDEINIDMTRGEIQLEQFNLEKFSFEDPKNKEIKNDHLLQAALQWSFDPGKLNKDQQQQLRSLVVDPEATAWTLKSNERQRILQSAGSLDALQLQPTPKKILHPGQVVINRILAGPPYNVNEIQEAELPYWLQAVRWFSDIIPGLPSPVEINTVLERKRTRSWLLSMIEGFTGRDQELKEIKDWFDKNDAGPLLVTGVGGMGKSALIAYFVYGLPQETLLLWLDFDRADLAPDDAVSLLKAISEQAAVQLPGFLQPEVDETTWKENATELGKRIKQATEGLPLPLLVLDGFEVAQHVKQYHEIWDVLELILAEVPRLKIIVSGRAPVKSLKLGGKAAVPLTLEGLEPEDATTWLKAHKISKKKVVEQVINISLGIPLRLKLAVRLIESGGSVDKVPKDLPKTLVEGYLYRRILDRIMDPVLEPIVKDVLILRKCSQPMIEEMFTDKIPAGLTVTDMYQRLSREMSLVGDSENLYPSIVAVAKPDILELRPEVRAATLGLLEKDDPKQVLSVDEKAVTWYSKQDLKETENVAELVYHLLRLKKLDDAKKVWRIECVPLLKYSVEELPASAVDERHWLEQQVGKEDDDGFDDLSAWEIQAALEIKNKLSRGITRGLSEMLYVRKERTDNSPLLIYDAWDRWLAQDSKGALALLQNARPAEGPVLRDRLVLQAFFAEQLGDIKAADDALQKVSDVSFWSSRQSGEIEAMAVKAARVRLTVDLKKEIAVYKTIKTTDSPSLIDFLKHFLHPGDLITPQLNNMINLRYKQESYGSSLMIPMYPDSLKNFLSRLQEQRKTDAPFSFSLYEDLSDDSIHAWKEKVLSETVTIDNEFKTNVAELAVKGAYRWRLATQDMLLADLCRLAEEDAKKMDILKLAVVSTLAAFRGQEAGALINNIYFANIDELLQKVYQKSHQLITEFPGDERMMILKEMTGGSDMDLLRGALMSHYSAMMSHLVKEGNPLPLPLKFSQPETPSIILCLVGPQPIQLLCKRILGLPDHIKLIP
ncbi:MAG: serine protease [Chitinophagaceae bacterium]